MQGHTDPNKDKVVSIFSARKSVDEPAKSAAPKASTGESFADIMRRNAENLDRMRRERLQANKGVIKSYKLKD
ncbi:MAG: hypothetical protein RIQ81_563 [Pseudomonadota bacterium]|jgi:hypothetical protein